METGGIFQLGAASISPRPGTFSGPLSPEVNVRLKQAENRSVLQSVARADAAAVAADEQDALAGFSASASTVRLDARAKAFLAERQQVKCADFVRIVEARKHRGIGDRALLGEPSPCLQLEPEPAASTFYHRQSEPSVQQEKGLLSMAFKPKPQAPCDPTGVAAVRTVIKRSILSQDLACALQGSSEDQL